MKIYLDLQKQAITKTTDENIYQGDIYSNAFEILFYNYTDSNWFPTMSQLAPNGRKAGEFTADALDVGESHEYTEDGVTYLKFTFTMGTSWVLMKGRSEFYIWFNRLGGAIVQKKCVGVVNIMIDHSTEDYFIADPTFNPNVKAYIDACIAELGDGSPKYFDTASNIANCTEDKGLAVATDTGHLYYWDETKNSTTKYTDSGLVYNDLSAYYTKTETNTLLAQKQDNLTFDSTPTANSTNPVTSGGVKTALDTKADSTTVSGIDNRVGALENEITDLQSVQNVVDVVATKSALNSYDTSKLEENDKIQVIADETHDGASTIYNWNGSTWAYVGAYGTNSYTKDEINNYKKMWDNLVYSCEFTIDDSAKTMTISGNWAFTKYSFVVISNISIRTISYASLQAGNYCLVIRNNALEFVNFANAIQDGDMVLWIGFLDGTGDIRTDIYRCNNKVTNLALYCSDNIKIDTANKNFVIPNSYLFWNSGYASITAQNISYASYLNATCVLVYRNGVFKVLGLQNIELFYNDVIVAVVWFRNDGFPLSKIYVVNEAPDKAITELPLSSKIFMRVGVIGDSYTSGWIKDNDHKNNPNYSWVKYMKQLTGNEWTNFGVSGSSTKSWVDGTLGKLPQVQTKGNKCQAYVIGLMINDQNQGMQTYVPLGTSSDIGTNANSYYAYYYKLINALLSVNSSAIIFCNTCPRTDGDFPSYNQAVVDVVNYCQNESKNVYLVELRNYYWRNETFNNDALNGHYTAIGYEYMAEIFNKAFSDTINANASSLKEVNLIPYDSATVYDYVDNAINDLRWELGSHTLDVSTDTDTKYLKNVPSGAIGCQINKIGGMSYKSENLANIQNNSVTDKNIDYVASNENQTLTLNGTSSGGSYKNFEVTTIPAGTYYVTVLISGTASTSCNLYLMSPDVQSGAQIGTTSNPLSNQQVTFSTDVKYLRVNVTSSDIAFTNLTIRLMISKTSITQYEAHFDGIRDSEVTSVVSKDSNNTTLDTLEIPTAIQNLTGYGWGINDTCYNYIDFDRKVFVQKVARVDLGILNWEYQSGNTRFRTTLSDYKKTTSQSTLITALSSMYKIVTWIDNYSQDDMCLCGYSTEYGQDQYIYIRNLNYTDATTFKSAMNGVYLYYELATPIETDISAYLTTDTIDVEPLGTLEFTNTYSQDVPSDVDYLIEEVKA